MKLKDGEGKLSPISFIHRGIADDVPRLAS